LFVKKVQNIKNTFKTIIILHCLKTNLNKSLATWATIQTNTETQKHKNTQAIKQTNMQASKQASTQANKHSNN